MDRKKIIYIGIVLIITVFISVSYFSYAFFTSKEEYHGRLNMVVGTLDYKIESEDLNSSNQITIPANTEKKLELEIESLNTIDSKYELYYTTTSSDVDIGYSTLKDNVTGMINAKGKKTVILKVTNTGSSSATITFGVEGGFTYNTLVLSSGKTSIEELDPITVTFDYNDGVTTSTTKQVVYGEEYGSLPEPTRTGYTFKGWNGKNLLNYNELTDVAVQYGFNVNSEGYISDSTPDTDYRAWGYNNSNWKFNLLSGTYNLSLIFLTKASNSGAQNSSAYDIRKSDNSIISNCAQGYLYNKESVVVQFNLNKQTDLSIMMKSYDGVYRIQLEEGTTATPWEPYYIQDTTTVTQTQNHTLTAIWEPNTYTVTLDANGGSIPATTGWTGTGNTSTKEVTYDSAYGTLPEPTRTGYTFIGWTNENKSNYRLQPTNSTIRLYNGTSDSNSLYPYNLNEVIVFDVSITGSTISNIDVNDIAVDSSNYTNTGTRVYGSIDVNSQMYKRYRPVYKFMDINSNSEITNYTVNKFYVLTTENTTNLINSNHTLTAIWEEDE